MRPPDFTADDVLSRFDYDREAGVFRWRADVTKPKMWNVKCAGKIAGSVNCGRRIVCVNYQDVLNYHLVWLVETGTWPGPEIDHIDCDSLNDRIGNLRLATHAQNAANARRRRNNASGFKGVHWDKARGKWSAFISINNRNKGLGRFDDPQLAHQAYLTAAREHFKDFTNEG
jgi:hypothetical protein